MKMKPAENIERLIEKFCQTKKNTTRTSPELDKDVIEDAIAELQTPAGRQINIWRTVMESKLTRLATAAVVIIAVIITAHRYGRTIDGTSIAFADVLKQINNFRPYVYKQTVRVAGNPDDIRQIMYLTLSQRREIRSDGSIWIFDMSEKPVKVLALYPGKKEAMKQTLEDMGPVKDFDLLRTLGERKDGTEENLGEKTIDGHAVKGFHLLDKINDFTVWADAKTGLPIRVELVQEQIKRTIILEDFKFDANLDPSFFNTNTPQGYSVQEEEIKTFSAQQVPVQQVIKGSTFETYVFARAPSWTRPVQIIEASDPGSPGNRMYVFAAVADDGRHLVLVQSKTYNSLGPQIRKGQLVYTSPNGFKVWKGGPEKWYSETLLKSARDIIPDSPSENRVGFALESPAGTFPLLAVNGPITGEELHSIVDNLVPAEEYKPDSQ
jgi:outer membrane lipoprotein-sorting protein